jgi:hypothetical protein
MSPATIWKCSVVLAAFLAIPAGMLLPNRKRYTTVAATPGTEGPAIGYLKPSPFAVSDVPKIRRRPKIAPVHERGLPDRDSLRGPVQ